MPVDSDDEPRPVEVPSSMSNDAFPKEREYEHFALYIEPSVADALSELAKSKKVEVETIFKDAIALELALQKEIAAGNQIFVGKGRTYRKVYLPR